jgi:hypothetical protein
MSNGHPDMGEQDPWTIARDMQRGVMDMRKRETPSTERPALTQEFVQGLIAEECDSLKELLLEKNKAYGNSALDPVRVFSKASAEEQILVRLDDKLSRLKRGSAAGEDVIQDLLGYLVLLRIARKLNT